MQAFNSSTFSCQIVNFLTNVRNINFIDSLNNNNNNNNNIYTGGVLTLSGFRNGPVKNIIKKKIKKKKNQLKSYIRKYCIILKKYDIKNSKN